MVETDHNNPLATRGRKREELELERILAEIERTIHSSINFGILLLVPRVNHNHCTYHF